MGKSCRKPVPDGTTKIMHSLVDGIRGTRSPDRPQRGIQSQRVSVYRIQPDFGKQPVCDGPRAPKSAPTNREIWLKPALCKIARQGTTNAAAVSHILRQDGRCTPAGPAIYRLSDITANLQPF